MLFALDNQPLLSSGVRAGVEGEIYNVAELCQRFGLFAVKKSCDVIPLLYSLLGAEFLHELDGVYAGVLYDYATDEYFSIRDPLGEKPLFMARTGTQVVVVHELKSLDCIADFKVLPAGLAKLDLTNMTYEKVAVVNDRPKPTAFIERSKVAEQLNTLLVKAVVKRLPAAEQPVGLFLSGGLDSSVLACILIKMRPDTHFYTLGTPDSDDVYHVERLVDYLGIQNLHRVAVPDKSQLTSLLADIVCATQSFNPSIISNGLCSYLLAQQARENGVTTVLSGEGADELFCGYHMFSPQDDWALVRRQLLDDLSFTELRRVHLTCQAHAIDNQNPYLDREIQRLANSLGYSDFYDYQDDVLFNKFVLRAAFANELPDEIVWRKKVSTDVGSGVRGLVVRHLRQGGLTEREALYRIWQKVFAGRLINKQLQRAPYFSAYPVFDNAIDQRGAEHK